VAWSSCALTSDVRGGLRLAARRPLDGDVRRTRLSKGMTGTRYRYRRERLAFWPIGTTLTYGDFRHLVLRVGRPEDETLFHRLARR
jgi:hypothetical protein